MKKIIIHVGLPKTATSALQHDFFKKLHQNNKINYLGRISVEFEPNYFNPLGELLQNRKLTDHEIKEKVNKLLSSDLVNVYSEECLSLTHTENNWIKRFKEIFHDYDVEVLMTLRDPYEFFYSYYVELYHWHYQFIPELDSYEKFKKIFLLERERTEFDIFNFYKNIMTYKREFKKIRVFLYEDIVNNSSEFKSELLSIFGLDISSYSADIFSEKVNARIVRKNGKESESTTLDQIIGRLVSKLIPKNPTLKNTLKVVLHGLYGKIIGLSRRVVIKPSILHLKSNVEEREKIIEAIGFRKKEMKELHSIGILKVYGSTLDIYKRLK